MNYSKHRNDFEKAIFDSKLSNNQKLVAQALKYHMNNDTGKCFPSLKTLAAECSIGQKTVQRAIDALEDAGFITKFVGSGRGKPTQYTLHVIQSDVDNRNKHKGNTTNLIPSYSADADMVFGSDTLDEFDVEHTTDNTARGCYPNDMSEDKSNNLVTVLDEYGQPISLAKLPENERENYAAGLMSVPAATRRKLLEGRIEHLRKQQQETLHSSFDQNTPKQIGSYDDLNEISQEADDDPYDV